MRLGAVKQRRARKREGGTRYISRGALRNGNTTKSFISSCLLSGFLYFCAWPSIGRYSQYPKVTKHDNSSDRQAANFPCFVNCLIFCSLYPACAEYGVYFAIPIAP